MGVLFLIFFIILIIALIAVFCICDESAERTDEIEPTITTTEYLENEKARLARDAAARSLRLNMMAMEAERQLMDAVSRHSKDGYSQDREW